MAAQPVEISCRDGCGTKVTLDPAKGEIEPPAGLWVFLSIQKSWRCINCVRLLEQSNTPRSTNDGVDGT